MKESEMLSLFDYLGYPAGTKLGAQVYKEAKYQKIPVKVRSVSTKKYTGEIMLYPKPFLEEYFNNQK